MCKSASLNLVALRAGIQGLALERATPEELAELLVHALPEAGAAKLMTPELIATLADHAQGNPRALMNIAAELLDGAAQREARHIDEKGRSGGPRARRGRTMSASRRGTSERAKATICQPRELSIRGHGPPPRHRTLG